MNHGRRSTQEGGTTLNVAIAVGLVVVASFGFAGGAILQHTAIKKGQGEGTRQLLSLGQLRTLLHQPRWLLGMALVLLGAVLHIVALALAPVTVVQPIGILAVVWSVLLAARINRYRLSSVLWLGVGAVVVGIVGFTLIAARVSDDELARLDTSRMIIAVAVCVLIALALLALSATLSNGTRSLVLAAGGAVMFGLGSALLKSVFVAIKASAHPTLVVGVGLLAGASLAAGGWLVQQAYAIGHPEIVVAALTTIDPVVAVIFGLRVLNEGAGVTAGAVAAMALFGAVAALGVATVSRYHPEAQHVLPQPLASTLTDKE